jgi:hypothetical protein
MLNYDPNIRRATQKVKLTFAQWEYRWEAIGEVGGNCKGLDIFDSAVNGVNDDLWAAVEDGDHPCIEMKNDTGESLFVEPYDDYGDDWLKQMLISAEIISIEKEP